MEVARSAGSFTTLLAALDAAGLTGALQGDGPFTVFAPTDEAFSKLPEGTVEALLGDPATLGSILKYHVVAGRVEAAQVVNLSSAATLNGASVSIRVEGGVVKVDDATVVQTDIQARNGVIHVIDAVILPPASSVSFPRGVLIVERAGGTPPGSHRRRSFVTGTRAGPFSRGSGFAGGRGPGREAG